jgi:hypothetical protein
LSDAVVIKRGPDDVSAPAGLAPKFAHIAMQKSSSEIKRRSATRSLIRRITRRSAPHALGPDARLARDDRSLRTQPSIDLTVRAQQ